METVKSYTDIKQSKKLAEILPFEGADMGYLWNGISFCEYPVSKQTIFKKVENIPCWSLAALLNILPKKYYPIKDHKTDLILCEQKDKWCVLYWDATGMQDGEQTLEDNLVDACVSMILKLHELNLL